MTARWELCIVGAALPTNSCGSGLKWSIQSGVTKSKKDKEINSIEMRKPSCSERTDMRQFGALIGKWVYESALICPRNWNITQSGLFKKRNFPIVECMTITRWTSDMILMRVQNYIFKKLFLPSLFSVSFYIGFNLRKFSPTKCLRQLTMN